MFKSETKSEKLKWTIPAAVFVLGCIVLLCVLHMTHVSNQQHLRTVTELNAVTYAERMAGELNSGIAITDALEGIIISENGSISNFQRVAENLMTEYIQSVQLAPDGVVTDIYPEAVNEAGKIDLINDETRGKISRYARDNKLTVLQGPFSLKQGGRGIAIRNPVYLQNSKGHYYFWGFTVVIIRVPDIFANSVQALTGFGYEYCLSKTASPLSSEYDEISSSGAVMENPVPYEFELGGCRFKLEVMPSEGWNSGSNITLKLIIGLFIVMLLTGLTVTILVLERHRENFKRMSSIDSMTGLLNRNGFSEQTESFIKNNPEVSCVAVQMDIDDFKFINDVYGHAAGDFALQELAKNMREYFCRNAIIGRIGGDEFSMLLTEITCEEACKQIQAFTEMQRCFRYDDKERRFNISLGYAGYPDDYGDVSALFRAADMALYEAKLQGKHNCVHYSNDFKMQKRSRLGFALHDISQHLPGAFLIYKADPEDDSILFANRELIEFAGCRNMDELMEYSHHRFRNLIRPDEQEGVEKSIWKQINSENSDSNDYVQFHFAKKDGSYHPVLDHGRIVENTYYGKIFYVLIIDCDLIEEHYE